MFRRKKQAAKQASEKSSQERVSEILEAGGVKATITFEVVGKPKEHVEKSMKEYLANLKKDSRITVLKEDVADAVEQDELWSTFAEVELVVNEIGVLTWIAVNFSPASIEVEEPAEKRLSAAQLNAWFNDLLSKLHEISFEYRDTLQKNQKMNLSLNALIKNAILAALESGNHDAKELQRKLGIHHEQLKPFLDHLVEKKQIKEAKGTYALDNG